MLIEDKRSNNGRRQLSINSDDYLDDLEVRRNALIMELRSVDKRLMAGGRLKSTHVPGHYQDRNR